jgi:GNAT superfamily N-acetyltransferase
MLFGQFWVGNPGSFAVLVVVDPGLSGQGIGRTLYARLARQYGPFGTERVYARVREDRPSALAFAHSRGFDETGHVQRISRLDLDEVRLDGYEGLRDRLEAGGIRVKTLQELGADSEDLLRDVHHVQMETARDEPTPEPFNVPFEAWREFYLRGPGISPASVFVAVHEQQPIGLTMLKRQGAESAWNQGMGVQRQYRGRGVARLLKLRSMEWAREQGLRFLYTGNDINNPRMYDINVRLGYRPLPAVVVLARDVAE